MLCAAARDAGARVVSVGGRPRRRELAREFGAEPGDGTGADVVIEAVGNADAWQDALRLVRPGGTVVFFGGREVAVDTFQFHYQSHRARRLPSHSAPRRAALAFLASGAYPWERLVTHTVGLEQVAGLFADPPPDLLKAAVVP